MTDDLPQNPYQPRADDPTLAPFAGRQAAFARLHQHLTDTNHQQAVLFMGQRHIGKTALLRQFDGVFDDSFVGVFVALKTAPLDSETHWLLALYQASAAVIGARGFTLTRLSEPPIDASDLDMRDWLEKTGLPELFTTIRPHRRLVWLMDDADHLINTIVSYQIAIDHFGYLQGLLTQHAQLSVVLTIDSEHEAMIDAMSPLASSADVFRLTNLALDETAAVLQQPVNGQYTVPDDAVTTVQQAAGGQPLLAQRFGAQLFARWAAQPGQVTVTANDVKTVTLAVYNVSEDDFKMVWQGLSQNERLVLTAMSSLVYDDPLHPINPESIQAWLVETDYPTDITAINAALRSLEYREIVTSTATGLSINAGLLQKWLVENARLTANRAPETEAPSAPNISRRWWWRWVAIVGVISFIVLLIIISLSSGAPRQPDTTPNPTATLMSTPP